MVKVDEGLKNDNVGVNSQVPSFTVEELMKDLTEYSLPDLSELNGYTNTPSQVYNYPLCCFVFFSLAPVFASILLFTL